jgi:hypothetical protein
VPASWTFHPLLNAELAWQPVTAVVEPIDFRTQPKGRGLFTGLPGWAPRGDAATSTLESGWVSIVPSVVAGPLGGAVAPDPPTAHPRLVESREAAAKPTAPTGRARRPSKPSRCGFLVGIRFPP